MSAMTDASTARRLAGKTGVIFGAGGDVGGAVARELAAQGCGGVPVWSEEDSRPWAFRCHSPREHRRLNAETVQKRLDRRDPIRTGRRSERDVHLEVPALEPPQQHP
jgi:NAD(P)-dependent dehydrogenase (short-subunit alcohol dehydrogenase family)